MVLVLVHNSPATLEQHRDDGLGILCSPRRFYGPEVQSWPWAADNDAFSNWDPGLFRHMLAEIRGRTGCLFVTAPDVVGDYLLTTRLLFEWRAELEGFPVAFVAQDDQERHPVPWAAFDALFIGGTTEWKLSEGAERLILEARERGKWIHVGRVNSMRRARKFWMLADSIDGSAFNRYRDARLVPFLARPMLRAET